MLMLVFLLMGFDFHWLSLFSATPSSLQTLMILMLLFSMPIISMRLHFIFFFSFSFRVSHFFISWAAIFAYAAASWLFHFSIISMPFYAISPADVAPAIFRCIFADYLMGHAVASFDKDDYYWCWYVNVWLRYVADMRNIFIDYASFSFDWLMCFSCNIFIFSMMCLPED